MKAVHSMMLFLTDILAGIIRSIKKSQMIVLFDNRMFLFEAEFSDFVSLNGLVLIHRRSNFQSVENIFHVIFMTMLFPIQKTTRLRKFI